MSDEKITPLQGWQMQNTPNPSGQAANSDLLKIETQAAIDAVKNAARLNDCRRKYPLWKAGQAQRELFLLCMSNKPPEGISKNQVPSNPNYQLNYQPCDDCGVSNIASCLYCARDYIINGATYFGANLAFLLIGLIGVWILASGSVEKIAEKVAPIVKDFIP